MTCRLNDDEYERVLIKISKSGLSKQEYILSSLLENQRMINEVLTNLNHQIKGASNGNN